MIEEVEEIVAVDPTTSLKEQAVEMGDAPYGGPLASSKINAMPTGGTQEDDPGHVLSSTKRGESNIERLAEKIETRRANRIPVTFEIRKHFLKTCRKIAQEEGVKNKISESALIELRDDYKAKVKQKNSIEQNKAGRLFGFWDKDVTMLELLDGACDHVDEVEGSWFFYRDFNFYNTVIARRIQFLGNPLLTAVAWLLSFYFFSAILFCPIMKNEVVCPNRDSFDGWLTAVYFASVTMSTVGYGDVSLVGENRWTTFIGIAYMLAAMGIAYTVFSTAADAALGAAKVGDVTTSLLGPFLTTQDDQTPLYKQVRRIAFLRIFELVIWFLILNLIGVFVARLFIRSSDIEKEQWDWMTTLYWAIQTTTTIGYGDLDMPFDMRWFQIFFTTVGTAFVGAVFGAAASMKSDIADLRRFYAWKRREISKRLIEDMQGPEADNKVDQFEFLVGSLLMLNKIASSDVEQIMDKFRELAGNKGYIMHSDAVEAGEEAAERNEAQGIEEDEDMKCEIDGGVSGF